MLSNGDGGAHLVLKIDVEGAEWDAFRRAPEAAFERVDQMAVEFHFISAIPLEVIRKLKMSFYIANLHFNNFACNSHFPPFPAWAYEVLLVNKRIGQPVRDYASYVARVRNAFGFTRPEPPNPLDEPNRQDKPDCQVR